MFKKKLTCSKKNSRLRCLLPVSPNNSTKTFRFTWSDSKQDDSNTARSMAMYVGNDFRVIVLV